MSGTAQAGTVLTVAAAPGVTPRLLRLPAAVETHSAYLADGGYALLDNVETLLAEVDRSGLLGRGGAAFPLGVKLRTVRAAHLRGHETVVVANGEEGEPASVKDRWLLRHRPHLVLDGVRLAARLVGAQRAYVYVSDRAAALAVDHALDEVGFDTLGGLDISIVTVDPGSASTTTAIAAGVAASPARSARTRYSTVSVMGTTVVELPATISTFSWLSPRCSASAASGSSAVPFWIGCVAPA